MTYLDIGNGEEVLVLIHGLGSTKESWQYQFELAKDYRLIIPDLRGHGETNAHDDISVETFARDVLNLLASLHIEQAHFCGLSLGGVVVQEIYALKPDCVLSMILSNTFSYVPFSLGFLSYTIGLQELKKRTPEEFATITAERCLFNKTPSLIKETQETFLIRKEGFIPSSKSAIRKNYLPMLPFVKVPVLVIGASDDPIIPLLTVYQTAWFTPKSKVYVFDECGHMPNIEKRKEYNEVLYRFLMKESL